MRSTLYAVPVLGDDGGYRGGGLRTLHGSEKPPEQRDGGLALFEAPASPAIHPVLVGAEDLATAKENRLKPEQHIRNVCTAVLRHLHRQP